MNENKHLSISEAPVANFYGDRTTKLLKKLLMHERKREGKRHYIPK